MTPDIDAVMQAADNVLLAKETGHYDSHLTWASQNVLIDFALSILPKGKRPVAMNDLKHGADVWVVVDYDDEIGVVRCEVRRHRGTSMLFAASEGRLDRYWEAEEYDCYPSDVDARLALHWKKFNALTPFAS